MKKRIVLLAALAFALLPLGLPADAAAGNAYRQDFSDAEAVNRDFGAYYLYQMGGVSERVSVGASREDGESWYLGEGALHRQAAADDEIAAGLKTNSIAILTLETRKYVNFELTVDYRMGPATYYWPVVAFRQSEAGRYFLEDGAGVFVQREGAVTIWGTDGVGGPFESQKLPGYLSQANEWHTMRVRLEGLELKVYVDDMSKTAYSRTLPKNIFRSGYLSLVSVNNDCSFRALSVTELPTASVEGGGAQTPVPDAGTPDSLGTLAERVERIDELAGLEQGETPPEPAGTGCGKHGSAATSVLLCAAGLFVLTWKGV